MLFVDRLQQNRRLLVLLALGSLTVMPGAVIAPVLPEIIQQLQLDRTLAGYLVSAHYLTVAIFSPVLGILAERLGSIRILVISAILFALSGAAGTLTADFFPMLMTRGLMGVATGGIAAASLGILAKDYPNPENRSQAIAYASATITLANIVYPFLAGWIGSGQWQFAFYLYGLALPLGVLAALILPNRRRTRSTASDTSTLIGRPLRAVLSHTGIVRLLPTVGISAAIGFATIIYLPMHLRATLDTEPVTNGLVLACQAIGAAFSALGVRPLIQRIGAIPTIVTGLSLMAIGLLILPQLDALALFIPTALLFGAGMGLALTSHFAAIANLAPMELQTIALAVATSMNFLGQFSSPTLFGWVLRQSSVTTVFYTAAGLAILTGLFLLLSASHPKKGDLR
ncbi:MFS transporter [filamentous cyanobacterium CCP1]|nr:MFS transporter [filamentous cyanobacterium CCP2]PSB67787.1 MFS transporter [filamentous cyanobacterium CCP1]